MALHYFIVIANVSHGRRGGPNMVNALDSGLNSPV